eukprot:778477_1
MAAMSFWEPVSFKENMPSPHPPKKLKSPSIDESILHPTTTIHTLPTPKSCKSPTKTRKSKRHKQIQITPEYLTSLGIPIFEDDVYDNGYLC